MFFSPFLFVLRPRTVQARAGDPTEVGPGDLPFFRRFWDSRAAVSGFVSSFLLSSSFFFPLSFSGPAWVLFLSLLPACRQDFDAWTRQVRRSTCLFCLRSLLSCSLSPGRLPSPLLFLFLSSLSLSFFLSCMHQLNSDIPPVLLGIPWAALRGPLRNQFR